MRQPTSHTEGRSIVTTASHRWTPITDLTEHDRRARSEELPTLADVWADEHARLGDDRAVQRFNVQMQREWAIETGVIERVYSLDRGVTQLLIEQGIDSSLIPHDATDKAPEFVARIIKDQQEAIEWLFDFVATRRPLSTSLIRELHALMTQSQLTTEAVDQFGNLVEIRLLHGEYKQRANNPTRQNGSVHEYCPPEHVAAEMDRLTTLHEEHQTAAVPPEVEAAWLHHRFTQIHPFQDGNGRIARALATLVFLRAGWFPLVITRDTRLDYYCTRKG